MSYNESSIDRFSRFEEDFLNSSRIVTRTISQLSGSRGNADTIISLCVDLEFEMGEAEAYTKAMDVEFRSLPSGEKKNAQQKINGYKEEVKQLKEHYVRTKKEAEALALKTGSASRQKIVDSQQKMDNTTRLLEQSRQLIAQTDNIGNETISNMENQKDQLIGATAKVDETRAYTANAKDVLVAMGNRALRHTACVCAVIIILLGLNVLVIYFAFVDKKD